MPAIESPSSVPNPRRRVLGAGALIAIAAVAAYHNSFSVPFFFDDRAQITDNPTIRHLWSLRTVLSPPVKAGVGGRPLLNFSFALNYALGGMNVWGYHAYNLVIHILAGLTLFGIVRRTLVRGQVSTRDIAPRDVTSRDLTPSPTPAGPSDRVGDNSLRLSFIVALIWTVHPLQTEAVTYVAERAESQMGLFYLLTLYFFIRSADESESERRKAKSGNLKPKTGSKFPLSAFRFPLLSFVACLLGIATKEVVVTAPLIVFLYDRTFVSGTFREAWRQHWRIYLGYAGTWLLLAYLMANLKQRGVGLDLGGGSWWAYALTESRAIVHYIRLAFWPHPLVFDYGMGVKQPGWGVLPDVLIVLTLLVAAGWALCRTGPNRDGDGVLLRPAWRDFGGHALGFAGAWFFIILAPTSSVIAVAGQPIAEHRMYLPLAAVISIVVCGSYARVRRLRGQASYFDIALRDIKIRGLTPYLVIALVLLCLTVRRNHTYRTEESLWSDTVAKQPDNERAQNGLGLVLAGNGDLSAAMERYREAIRLNPDYPDARQNLAAALSAEGRLPEAVAECEEVVRLRPRNPESYENLGVALQLEGQSAAAITEFSVALSLNPDDAGAEGNLGLALVSLGRFAEAAAHFGRAVQLRPRDADLRLNLGSALFNSGDIAGAVGQMQEAVRLEPGAADAHYNLAVALQKLGKFPEAAAELAEARRLGLPQR